MLNVTRRKFLSWAGKLLPTAVVGVPIESPETGFEEITGMQPASAVELNRMASLYASRPNAALIKAAQNLKNHSASRALAIVKEIEFRKVFPGSRAIGGNPLNRSQSESLFKDMTGNNIIDSDDYKPDFWTDDDDFRLRPEEFPDLETIEVCWIVHPYRGALYVKPFYESRKGEYITVEVITDYSSRYEIGQRMSIASKLLT